MRRGFCALLRQEMTGGLTLSLCVSESVRFIDRKLNWKSQYARLISARGGKGGPHVSDHEKT